MAVVSRRCHGDGVSPRFWGFLTSEPLAAMDVLDVGTGRGRLALALGPHCRRVVGIDLDAAAIEEARRRAAGLGLTNVEFAVADAERIEFPGIILGRLGAQPHMVTAHLYLSDSLMRASSQVLAPGGLLAIAGFHADQWRETGRRSRFAYDETQVRQALEACDFDVVHLEVEREVRTFGSVEEALADVLALEDRWRQDARWFNYIKYLEDGGRELTRSYLLVKGRRR
jgi:SAM-dependent methyltransferase